MTAPSQLSALVSLSMFCFLHSFEEFTLLYCYCIYRHSHCRSDTWLVCLSHVMVNPHPKSSISALHFSGVTDLTVTTVKHGSPQRCRAFDVLYNDQVNSSYTRGCLCMLDADVQMNVMSEWMNEADVRRVYWRSFTFLPPPSRWWDKQIPDLIFPPYFSVFHCFSQTGFGFLSLLTQSLARKPNPETIT